MSAAPVDRSRERRVRVGRDREPELCVLRRMRADPGNRDRGGNAGSQRASRAELNEYVLPADDGRRSATTGEPGAEGGTRGRDVKAGREGRHDRVP